MTAYSARRGHSSVNTKRKWLIFVIILIVLLIAGGAFAAYKLWFGSTPEKAANQLHFDESVTSAEQQTIKDAVQNQQKTYDGTVKVSVQTVIEASNNLSVLNAFVPVTNVYSTRQSLTKADLANLDVYIAQDTDQIAHDAIAKALGVESQKLQALTTGLNEIPAAAVAFVPSSELTANIKLLNFEGNYYLDSFTKGAVFRQAMFSGDDADALKGLTLNNLPNKESTLKVNMTGVTALAREMMRKLQSVGGNATYFNEKIGPFLADADITHISNEVSFKEGCAYSHTVFCSPPEMIETLKASGVDLVELTGNHNNDVGRQYNTDTINLYKELGWGTFGGGLNAEEAAKPFIADQKGTKVAFLGYNYADSPGSGAIATSDGAGANGWNAEKVQADIAAAKQQADFVIVDVQFWECYSYPDGYVEFPECDIPIGQQSEVFRQIASYGANMVIGTQAHQPQTYEIYNDAPIYYGLGNLYFEQTSWPGTERGIVLTHYFTDGKLLQTKLTPTVYHSELQTQIMNNDDATYLLDRLNTARQTAGL